MLGLLILFSTAAVLLILLGSAAAVRYLTRPPRQTYAVALARRLPTSPADVGMEFVEHRLKLSDHHTTPAWIIQGKDDDAPVVIITHGWADGRYGSLGWARLLIPHASAVVVYDLRGMGESPAPASHLGTTEVADLLAITGQLDAARPIVFFGASMGMGISIAAAARAAEQGEIQIAGVIGEGGYRRGMEPIVCFYRLNRWPVAPFYPVIGAWLSLRYTTERQFDRARHAAKLKCPLLLLHGTEDVICPVTAARQIAAAAPDCRLVEFPGRGHLDLVELEPERYTEELTAFFARIRGQA